MFFFCLHLNILSVLYDLIHRTSWLFQTYIMFLLLMIKYLSFPGEYNNQYYRLRPNSLQPQAEALNELLTEK